MRLTCESQRRSVLTDGLFVPSSRIPHMPRSLVKEELPSTSNQLPSQPRRLQLIKWRAVREMLNEYARQRREVADAVANRCAAASAPTPISPRLQARQAAHQHLWPDLSSYANRLDAERNVNAWKCYRNIASTVLLEVSSADVCNRCKGLGVIVQRNSMRCICCDATGLMAATDHERAAAIGVAPVSYGASWRKVYEWVYERCVEHFFTYPSTVRLIGE